MPQGDSLSLSTSLVSSRASAPDALAQAALALSMAGRALDSNAPLGAKPELAAVLLKESVVGVARSFGEADMKGYGDALKLLDERGVFVRAFGNRAAAKTKFERLEGRSVSASVAADAELSVMKLLDCARGRRTTVRHEKAIRWGLVLLAIAALSVYVGFNWTHPWRRYPFRASSAYTNYHRTGELGDVKTKGLLFHTNDEDGPWIKIDLLGPRKVSSVVLKNRLDCCQSRGVPLVVEVTRDMRTWQTVAERRTTFEEWRADFAPIDARYLRVRSIGRNILHLRAIEIR
jgi:hypothetical protein